MYSNGFEFWRELVTEFGNELARQIANDYLDLQIHNKDKSEFEFCCQLYHAMNG